MSCRYCRTAQYNCCMSAINDCRRFCPFYLFFLFSLILYGAPAMSLTWQCHLNQYTVTYLLTYLLTRSLPDFHRSCSSFRLNYCIREDISPTPDWQRSHGQPLPTSLHYIDTQLFPVKNSFKTGLYFYLKRSRLGWRKCRDTTRAPNNVN